MKINQYEDISEVEKEAKKDYIDRHSPFIHCDKEAKKNEKFLVKVKVGNEYQHPDDLDHYISYVQLWDREKMLAQTTTVAGALGGAPSQLECDFFIVPTKNMKLTATAYCTKHGLWQSDVVEVEAN